MFARLSVMMLHYKVLVEDFCGAQLVIQVPNVSQ